MFRNILIAVDADRRADALRLLALAAELRCCFGASLTVATVLTDWSMVARAGRSPDAADRLFEVARARLAALAHKIPDMDDAEHRVETGPVHRGILRAAAHADADLILLASSASGWRAMLFGTAARVARRAACSVFILRG